MNSISQSLIHSLQSFPSEFLGVLLYLVTIACLFGLERIFGKEGIIVFIVLSVVLANIQSLKVIQLAFFDYPIAMGSILFTSTLLATDILSEFYGKKAAEKAIWLGFFGLLMVCLIMILTLGTQVIPALPGSPLYRYVETHQAMELLFSPSPALMLASLIAYLISQYTDMHIFLWLKKKTKGKQLSMRTFVATLIATFADNCIFSFLAWRIFYPLNIDLSTFFYAYIFGAFAIRIFVNVLNAPLMIYIRSQKEKRNPLNDAIVS